MLNTPVNFIAGLIYRQICPASALCTRTREKRSERSICMTLSLAFLDPKLIRLAINGNLPRGFSAKRLTELPMLWSEQWQALGLLQPA
jgi:hypothetical protein